MTVRECNGSIVARRGIPPVSSAPVGGKSRPQATNEGESEILIVHFVSVQSERYFPFPVVGVVLLAARPRGHEQRRVVGRTVNGEQLNA